MTREEAIKLLKQYQGYDPMFPDGETLKHAFDLTDETVDTLLSALRPVSREQVEKVWRGEWKRRNTQNGIEWFCSECGYVSTPIYQRQDFIPFPENRPMLFCNACGAPMTDEAVEMVMERMEKLKDADTNY